MARLKQTSDDVSTRNPFQTSYLHVEEVPSQLARKRTRDRDAKAGLADADMLLQPALDLILNEGGGGDWSGLVWTW
jgi:hypothetical protein